jgi:hypothetical protein
MKANIFSILKKQTKYSQNLIIEFYYYEKKKEKTINIKKTKFLDIYISIIKIEENSLFLIFL